VELLLLLLLLWSRKELGLASFKACTDNDEEDIGASQKQNPWQIVFSLSLSLPLLTIQEYPKFTQLQSLSHYHHHHHQMRISWWDRLNVICPLAKP